MTNLKLRNLLASMATATSLIVTFGAAATFALAPDTAIAKNDKGNGKGNSGKADNGGGSKGKGNSSGGSQANGGGKGNSGKADKGKGNSSKGSHANSGGKNKAKGKVSVSQKSSGSKKQHAAKAKKSKSGVGGNQKAKRVSLGDFGREFKKDVQQLFGKQPSKKTNGKSVKTSNTKAAKKTRTYKSASIKPIERSLRPVARYDGTPDLDGRKKHRHRDPLAAAITDPYGSDKLRNLNASKAAVPAFQNAAPNSNVGKIATYQAAAAEYYDLRDQLNDARKDLRDLNENYDGRSSDQIADDIARLDPGDPDYNDKLDTLENELQDAQTFEEAQDELRADVRDLRTDSLVAQKEAEHAFFEASKGSTLTAETLADLHENLELPAPGK